jgi:hypothetical protein
MGPSQEILEQIKSQISAFDTKAEILLVVSGIVFGSAQAFVPQCLEALKATQSSSSLSLAFYIIYGFFLFSGTMAVFFPVLSVFPRKPKKGEARESPLYYLTICKMDIDSLSKKLADEKVLTLETARQIKINSGICSTKHRLVVSSIISLFVMGAFFITMCVLSIFVI